MALGALGALWSLGYTVPQDTVVAGFDDVADGRHSIPPLTTISFDKKAFAETALKMLVERMDSSEAPVRRATIEHSIRIRESTGA